MCHIFLSALDKYFKCKFKNFYIDYIVPKKKKKKHHYLNNDWTADQCIMFGVVLCIYY